MAKKEKEEKVLAQYFSADLEMDRISKSTVRYIVKNLSGMKVQNLNTLEIARSEFPMDDNFSMNFINEDIAVVAKTGDKDAAEGVAVLLKKQAAFRQFKNLKLLIVAE